MRCYQKRWKKHFHFYTPYGHKLGILQNSDGGAYGSGCSFGIIYNDGHKGCKVGNPNLIFRGGYVAGKRRFLKIGAYGAWVNF